jgi:hypothetical protein
MNYVFHPDVWLEFVEHLAANNKSCQTFAKALQDFSEYLSDGSYDKTVFDKTSAPIVSSYAVRSATSEMGMALRAASLVTNHFATTRLVAKTLFRTDLASSKKKAPKPQVSNTEFLWNHGKHKGWSSWTLDYDACFNEHAESRREADREYREMVAEDGMNRGVVFSELILSTRDFKGKVIWTPDSVKVIHHMVESLKGANLSNNLSWLESSLKRIRNTLSRFEKEQEVVLFHPGGCRVKIVHIFEEDEE